jgi:hypothetical protein
MGNSFLIGQRQFENRAITTQAIHMISLEGWKHMPRLLWNNCPLFVNHPSIARFLHALDMLLYLLQIIYRAIWKTGI